MDEYPIIGVIFFYSFNAIVFFVLLNILLAILVEAYMKVVDDTKDAPSLVAEIKLIARSVFRDWQLGRDHHATSDHPESWMADHYVTQEEMMEAFGNSNPALKPDRNPKHDPNPDHNPNQIRTLISTLFLGDPPEDHYISKRKVVNVPLSEGVWLDAGLPAIMKALMMHPDTRDMDLELMSRIACTMIFRPNPNPNPNRMHHDLQA